MRREDTTDYRSLLTRWFIANGMTPKFSKFFCCDGNVCIAVDSVDKRYMVPKAKVVKYDESDEEIELEPMRFEITDFVKWRKLKFLNPLRRLANKIRYHLSFRESDFNTAGDITNEDCKRLLEDLKVAISDGEYKQTPYATYSYTFNRNVRCPNVHSMPTSYIQFNDVEDLELKLAVAGY